jgi:hypothetical protein
MPTDLDTHSPRHAKLFGLGEVIRIIGTALVAGAGVGYLLANYDAGTLGILARIASSVALVTVVLMVFEARRRCHIDKLGKRLDRIEALLDNGLERQRQWRAYADVLSDLGGVNGEDSGDIPTERGPRR